VGSISMEASVDLLMAPRGPGLIPHLRERDDLEHLARILSWQPIALTLAGRLIAHGGMSARQLIDVLSGESPGSPGSPSAASARWQPLFARLVKEAVSRLDPN